MFSNVRRPIHVITLFKPDCPAGQSYYCILDTPCPITCENPTGAGPCIGEGTKGCRCPIDQVKAADGSCQDPIATCPCTDDLGNAQYVGINLYHVNVVIICQFRQPRLGSTTTKSRCKFVMSAIGNEGL